MITPGDTSLQDAPAAEASALRAGPIPRLQSAASAMDIISPGVCLPIALNAPFTSGLLLDSKAAFQGSYGTMREQLCGAAERAGAGWKCLLREAGNGLVFDVDDYAGTPVLPPFWLQRVLSGEVLAEAMDPVIATAEDGVGEARLTIHRITLRFSDFGVGCATVDGTVAADAPLPVGAYRHAVERISSLAAERLKPLVADSVAQAARFIPAGHRLASPLGVADLDRAGAVPWVHRIFYLPVPAGEDPQPLREAARALIPRYCRSELQDCSLDDRASIYPGIGSSVAVYRADREGRRAADVLTGCIEAQNAAWFAAYRLNRELLRAISIIGVRREKPRLAELETEAERIFELYERLSLFRGIQLDHAANYSPQERALSTAIATAWDLPELMAGLQEKMTTLTDLHTRVTSRLSERQDKRLNAVVFFFTLISLAGIAIAVFEFTQAAAPRAPEQLRSIVLLGMFSALLGLGWLAYKLR